MIARTLPRYALCAALVLPPVFLAGPVDAAGFETQTNREGPVTVKVTPTSLSTQAASWDFEIAFETHTVPLDQDPLRIAALVDAVGDAHAPLAWEGDPAGGHHRKGLLRFKPLPELPGVVELRIDDVGGVARRVFRWRLAE